MNQVILVGRICRELEIKKVGEDRHVVNNVLAVNRTYKDRNGDSITDFIPFVAWNTLAKLLMRYACKGQRVVLAGGMQSRKYTDSAGKEVYVIECNVNEITLLDKPHHRKIGEGEGMNLDRDEMTLPQEVVEEVIEKIK
ncbi:single-stranded DNA-binding protein [Facklamia sp. DSM 111018]|uniref:Single-stranded DNA-binding protein n=1 Tax=Facklamia lactis TaxID=2749967 RepID=A0ABS0LQS1_9LACT|nr:single-stranded DNA-binding protein [Facklamia lactis]MBG9980690.1 single-stranded DNA-binding protein [Facklamia lactis]MBG9986504.1 single-stranded DNA-binding protein [Facklamia lactis]